MGVHGLWKLLEPAGKAVALEALQNKILGVDVSIWLHQAMKGFQDRKGSPLPNAHLLGIFHRVCKLLFYRIKPVFVFDGGVPVLKKSTIAARRKFKGQAARGAKEVAEQLLKNLVKHKAVRKVLGEKAGKSTVSDDRPRKDDNLFELPPMLNDLNDYQSLSSDSEASVKYDPRDEESESDQDVKYLSPSKMYAMNLDLHTLDVSSQNFRSLPADVRHDILSDLKETRKQSSWGRLHEMPKESTDFSSFQLNRLLKRRTVQVSLEEAEKEMGGKVLSIAELEDIMSAQGVKLEDGVANSKEAQLNAYSKRIASDVATRFLLVTESSKNKAPADSTADTKKEMKEDARDKANEKIKIKQEHQDDWSSDESVQEIKVEEVKIKQEFEDDWSSDEEAKKIAANENLAERFVNDKDSLSQAEILAVIQNEKTRDAGKSYLPHDVPSTSRAAGVGLNSTKWSITELSTSKALRKRSDFVEDSSSRNDSPEFDNSNADVFGVSSSREKVSNGQPDLMANSTSVANVSELSTIMEKVSADKTDFVEKSGLRTSSKSKVEVQTGNSPVHSDSDHDFDEVLPIEPEIIEKVISTKPVKKVNIEVVINKDQSFKPEDDIFADIFPVNETRKEILQLTPQKTTATLQKTTTPVKTVEIPKETPSKSEGLQKMVEDFVKEKVEIEQRKAQKTPEKIVNFNGEDENIISDIADVTDKESENRKAEIPRLSKEMTVPSMSSEELKSLESALEDKHEELLAEKGRQERLAASITDQMCAEAQELLRLFGVPFVVAPMEAEAQCAFLDSFSLTEGTITDDSDIWLFGGNKVYKNFFNQKKHVLQYTSTTIQHYLKLERNHMILLALLVGSDYTTGLQGIGPVTAMEVLAAFPPGKVDKAPENKEILVEGLRRFRDWWQAGRPQRSAATQQLRNKVKDLQFHEGFPSVAVVDAYLRPAVDESKEVFSWGDLDLQGLREFARMKFGWAQAKADEILLPVAKRVAERKSQRFIDSYFNMVPQYGEGDANMSKRVKKAVRRIGNTQESDSEDVDDPQPRPSRKRSSSQGGTAKKKRPQESDDSACGEDDESQPKPSQKRSSSQGAAARKRKMVLNEEAAGEQRQKSSIPRKRAQQLDTVDADAPSEPKKSRPAASVIKAKPQSDEGSSCTKDHDGLPKPRPRQRTSTGVVRTGAKKTVTGNEEVEEEEGEEAKTVTKKINQPRKTATNVEPSAAEGTVKKTTTKRTQPQKKSTHWDENISLDTVNEDEEDPISVKSCSTIPVKSSSIEPKPGTSGDHPEDADEEEEAILAALHAMDWDDDPWGGFEPPREKLFFGGVRKNPTKPRRPPSRSQPPPQPQPLPQPQPPPQPQLPPQPQPLPPPPPAQPIDTRGYRPGSLTLERIESRVTQPHLEWNSPSSKIPQKERDRQQAEESKMKAIKLFKVAGAMKTSKLLGEDPASSKRKPKKKKPVAKLKELNLSEESSSDD